MRTLYIFVEGPRDEDFFRRAIVGPYLSESYAVHIVKYAEKKSPFKNIGGLIKTIRRRKEKGEDLEYIFVVDLDECPCITGRKQDILQKFSSVLGNLEEARRELDRRILVVVKEIESWYLAGLNGDENLPETTEELTKEDFEKLAQDKRCSHIELMNRILDNFSVEIAAKKNRSFCYFCNKYLHIWLQSAKSQAAATGQFSDSA
ncbi:hypothetical protein [Ammonifex thiophilus]|uniref:DUF4276 family protein n=1 Tax=Ammonifex thiophilus TaxID=444093 RepID=A0A3D8P386_9THEO|nr:hypothetical protein [Ammonifex thiophilus]RDV80898.1 hypothetical protein DXX99_10315 [Ammonifex thiophilus]